MVTGKKVLSATVWVLICAIFLAIGIAGGFIGKSKVLSAIITDRVDRTFHIPVQNPFGQDVVTLLVLGCDEDWYFGGKQLIRHQARSDMMLLVRLDFANNRITGISIPRDTLVAADGHEEQKINAYHLLGGNDASKDAVQALLPEIQVDKVMALNFDAFKQMIDAVDGVDVYVPKNMNYDDRRGHLHIHLKAGHQHLNGDQAEGFVRFRHSDDDFHRTARQRDFVLAFKDTLKQHWTELGSVADKAVALTGHALTVEQIAYIADFAEKVGSDNIQMGMLPVVDANDAHFDLRIDEAKTPSVLAQYHFIDDGGNGLAQQQVQH
jgi:LCP family protein required for cell wall assembly